MRGKEVQLGEEPCEKIIIMTLRQKGTLWSILYVMAPYCLESQKSKVLTVNLKDENYQDENLCCLHWFQPLTNRKAGCCGTEQENKYNLSLTPSSAKLARVFFEVSLKINYQVRSEIFCEVYN